MSELEIDFKFQDERLEHEFGLPSYATAGSAAIDLRACVRLRTAISPGQHATFDAGFSIHIKDRRYAAVCLPRSGLGFKAGLRLRNGTGLIDSDYQGPIRVCLHNTGRSIYTVAPYERIAQMIIVPVFRAIFKIVDKFEGSERGTGGFGSSGRV